ncbi:MAG TPA: glycosyl hydrolase family 65 protein, partial [Negativicutes bacterium]|nr:glycosyl hydrolase family 65 protein [Negativicutes bacterium]
MNVSMEAVKPYYKLHEWEIIEDSFDPERNIHNETIFSIGNGFIGMRGTFEEGLGEHPELGAEGTFLNGVYEEGIIKYGEIAYGFPEKSQTMINVANGKRIALYLEDEPFDMQRGSLVEYKRSLSMKEGILRRSLLWQSPGGRRIRLETERMACFSRRNLVVVSYKVTPMNFDGSIRIASEIDGNLKHSLVEKDPRIGSGLEKGAFYTVDAAVEHGIAALKQKTRRTGITVACIAEDVVETASSYEAEGYAIGDRVGFDYLIEGKNGVEVALTRYIAYDAYTGDKEGIPENLASLLKAACEAGYEIIKKEQSNFLYDYWDRADVEIKGDLSLQQAIRFNLFHLLQAVGRDGRTNICAKGLTGEGYEGHYFWDTEMYVIPAFLYNQQQISRSLLEYRYNTLDKARARAREMSHSKGALFPWRTINGEECSGYFPASTAQYHINADIAHAVKKYMEATEDYEFLINYGAEVVFETARLWMDLGFFSSEKDGSFCINCVTGPDEYTAIVNNNFYTNLMAKENLKYAYNTAIWMKNNSRTEFEGLVTKLELEKEEVALWNIASDNIYLPYSEKHGIHPQDDSFLDKEVWDFENKPKEKYPLLLHYHPLVIYRHQVCKQADVVLALFLLGHQFTLEQRRRDYDYYEKVTTHDSSLSACIFSIVANDIGYHEKAYEYFRKTARMDLDDYQGNTHHGVHTANMAGSWMCMVNGFAGMRAHDDELSFEPYIHPDWEEYSFKITYRGRVIKLVIKKDKTTYELIQGAELPIVHRNKEYILKDTL